MDFGMFNNPLRAMSFWKNSFSKEETMKFMQSLRCHNFLNIGPNQLKWRPFDSKFNVDVENVVKLLRKVKYDIFSM